MCGAEPTSRPKPQGRAPARGMDGGEHRTVLNHCRPLIITVEAADRGCTQIEEQPFFRDLLRFNTVRDHLLCGKTPRRRRHDLLEGWFRSVILFDRRSVRRLSV
jgi:hypothetical protein